jgi:drug/metabolite transporter (DMT)-like permease
MGLIWLATYNLKLKTYHSMKPSHPITLAGFSIAIAGAVLFSTKAIFVKLAFRDTGVDALTLLMLRMLFSLPFYLAAVWLVSRKENQHPLKRKDWLMILAMGVLGFYLSSLFDFIGLQYISAGLERLILFLYPTFTVLINTWLFKTRLNRVQFIALVLTYLGIGIAYFGELQLDTSNPQFVFGSFMIFLCAITYACYLVGSGRMVQRVGVTRYTAYAMLTATAGIFIHFLVMQDVTDVQFSPTLGWYSVFIAVFATVVPSFMMSNAMKRIGSNNVSIITSIGPISTVIQAHFFLGEKIIPAQIAGTALVIAGVLLIGWKARKTVVET